jgi:hypothetical protein
MKQRIRSLTPLITMLWCMLAMPAIPAGASEPVSVSLTQLNAGIAGGGRVTALLSAPAAIAVAQAEAEQAAGFMASVDRAMGSVNGVIAKFFFADVVFWDNGQEGQITIPLVVLWLVMGSVYLTFRMGLINFRAFGHAINVTRGKYSSPDDPGEVSHFGALTAALSATVGLGNIAGVAIAIATGGPGATFWMIIAGLFGMTAKFAECTLGQKYREVRPDGRIMGGAMFYLSKGLAEMKMPGLGKFLAVFFAILCIGGSFAGGNAFQVNQSMNAVQETLPFIRDYPWMYGIIMTVLTGLVIIGGIKRIAATAEKIVPTMILIYVAASLWIIGLHAAEVPSMLAMIVREAFTPQAAYGGFLGVLIIGFRRAAFSNEAGAGSAAIAHSAARTEYRTGDRDLWRIQQSRVCRPHCRQSGRRTHVACDGRTHIVVPICVVGRGIPVRLLDDDFVVVLRRTLLGVSVRRQRIDVLSRALPGLHLPRIDHHRHAGSGIR